MIKFKPTKRDVKYIKKITKASIVGLSMLTVIPNVVCKHPKAMFSAIKSFFGANSSSNPNGLPNFGTTCYFNSMIQALSTSRYFREYISTLSSKYDYAQTLNDLFLYIDNTYECQIDKFGDEVKSDYNKLVEMCADDNGQHSPSETLRYLRDHLGVPNEKLPEEKTFDINGDELHPIEPDEVALRKPEEASHSYLYHWDRVDQIGSKYDSSPISICSRIREPRPDQKEAGNYLSNDFKLKCIICYDGNGVAGHYYVVREHRKNWFEISDQEVKLVVECKRKNEETIINELNAQYSTKALMAFYDYDPDYKIGV